MPAPTATAEVRVSTDLSARRVAEVGEFVGESIGDDVRIRDVDAHGLRFAVHTGDTEDLRFRLGIVETPDGTAARSRLEPPATPSDPGYLLYRRFLTEFVDTIRREDPGAVTAIHGVGHPG